MSDAITIPPCGTEDELRDDYLRQIGQLDQIVINATDIIKRCESLSGDDAKRLAACARGNKTRRAFH